MDSSLPGSSVHGISQARIMQWITTSFFWESSRPRDWTHSQVSCIAGKFFMVKPPEKSLVYLKYKIFVLGFAVLYPVRYSSNFFLQIISNICTIYHSIYCAAVDFKWQPYYILNVHLCLALFLSLLFGSIDLCLSRW